jgi:hypothetical protein
MYGRWDVVRGLAYGGREGELILLGPLGIMADAEATMVQLLIEGLSEEGAYYLGRRRAMIKPQSTCTALNSHLPFMPPLNRHLRFINWFRKRKGGRFATPEASRLPAASSLLPNLVVSYALTQPSQSCFSLCS